MQITAFWRMPKSDWLKPVVNLEPPTLGPPKVFKRIDDLEECIRILRRQISDLRCDFAELREWVVLDKVERKM